MYTEEILVLIGFCLVIIFGVIIVYYLPST